VEEGEHSWEVMVMPEILCAEMDCEEDDCDHYRLPATSCDSSYGVGYFDHKLQ
jgi:hypothetical protein